MAAATSLVGILVKGKFVITHLFQSFIGVVLARVWATDDALIACAAAHKFIKSNLAWGVNYLDIKCTQKFPSGMQTRRIKS